MITLSSATPRISLATPRLAGIIGCAAAVAAVAADLALEYTPNSAHLLSSQYLFLVGVPQWRLVLGHYLGICALPLEIAGFWLVYQGAQARRK
jgi:hypothetical protein